jgi:histidinol-phosphate aminotransferase
MEYQTGHCERRTGHKMTSATTNEKDTGSLIDRIRPSVRGEKEYIVGGGTDFPIKLNQNESPFDLPVELKAKLGERLQAMALNRYPAEQPETLRGRLAEMLDVEPGSVIVGNGSNELTYTLGMVFIDPGSKVVLPRPMFSLYEKVVRLHAGDLISVAPRPDLHFDSDAIRDAVEAHDPVLTVLTTPNNPTGLAMSMTEVESIVRAANGFVVVDEAYIEFAEETARPLLEAYPNVILMRTFSKTAGLAGLRIGYMVAHPDVAREIMKARLPFMVDRLAEAAALTVIDHPELTRDRAEFLKGEVRRMTSQMRAINGVEVLPSQANFVIFKTPLEQRLLMTRLAEAGVLVRDISSYPELKGYLRVNAGTLDENQAFLVALKTAVGAS